MQRANIATQRRWRSPHFLLVGGVNTGQRRANDGVRKQPLAEVYHVRREEAEREEERDWRNGGSQPRPDGFYTYQSKVFECVHLYTGDESHRSGICPNFTFYHLQMICSMFNCKTCLEQPASWFSPTVISFCRWTNYANWFQPQQSI